MERFTPNKNDWERYYINQAKNIVQSGGGYGVTSIKSPTYTRNNTTSNLGTKQRIAPASKPKISSITFKKVKRVGRKDSILKTEGSQHTSLTNKTKSTKPTVKKKAVKKKTTTKRNLKNKNKLSNIFH